MSKDEIITYNVNGIGNDSKRREVFNYLHTRKSSIIFLQETHSSKSTMKRWNMEWGTKIWASHGKPNARGVAILIAKNVQIDIHAVISSDTSRYILLCTTFRKHKVLLVNIYAPNRDSPKFFEEIIKEIDRFNPDYLIMSGDMNLALDVDLDRKGTKHSNYQARVTLNSFLDANNLIDMWRHFHATEQVYTWRRLSTTPVFSRLSL